MVAQKKKGRGRPKKTIQEKKEEVDVVEKVAAQIVEPVEIKEAVPKVKALVRLSHKGVTYEEGQVFEEEDEDFVEQMVANNFVKKV